LQQHLLIQDLDKFATLLKDLERSKLLIPRLS